MNFLSLYYIFEKILAWGMMMDEKLVNQRMIMDKNILAGDEDG
jgi:hypothetical protein